MLATALSASIVGVEGVPVRVEVDVAFGLPGLTIVGLAGSAVLEARERVRAALRNSGFEVPSRRITINLAPASCTPLGSLGSRSEGRVRLTSADPEASLDIRHSHLDEQADVEAISDGVELMTELLSSAPWPKRSSCFRAANLPGTLARAMLGRPRAAG